MSESFPAKLPVAHSALVLVAFIRSKILHYIMPFPKCMEQQLFIRLDFSQSCHRPSNDLLLYELQTWGPVAFVQGASIGSRIVDFQRAFWKFLRPHTIRGTILGSIAVTARALIESPVVRVSYSPRLPLVSSRVSKTSACLCNWYVTFLQHQESVSYCCYCSTIWLPKSNKHQALNLPCQSWNRLICLLCSQLIGLCYLGLLLGC